MVNSAPRRARGFTLLEVLVALAISALMLAALLPAAVSGVERLQRAHDHGQALRLARSLIERYAAMARFETGTFEGRLGDLVWTARIDQPQPQGSEPSLVVLRQVRVEVRRPGAPALRLSTQRVGERR